MKRVWGWFCVSLALTGCSTTQVAPVTDLTGSGPALQAQGSSGRENHTGTRGIHIVKKGDTLYSIALQYGLDYRELAAWNHLDDLNRIRIGQSLYVTAPSAPAVTAAKSADDAGSSAIATPLALAAPGTIVATQALPAGNTITQPVAVRLPYSKAALAQIGKQEAGAQPAPQPATGANELPGSDSKTANDSGIDWVWPAKGPLLARFGNADADKGINIGGQRDQPVYAAAAGKIVYSGSGLHGYGKLLIIKHNAIYLTAYAHNDQLLVKEGQTVSRGQKIAEMGDSDADRVELHFEVRKMGKPVDPLIYLPEEKK
ncbi:MAG TPA: peptidoglycan DD-metalloendopeptidase family protein [Burkholderiales bacterium]|nr:peptidoglycan DD-metalloendopeptidase family protein [Burkholderiales bacterium]